MGIKKLIGGCMLGGLLGIICILMGWWLKNGEGEVIEPACTPTLYATEKPDVVTSAPVERVTIKPVEDVVQWEETIMNTVSEPTVKPTEKSTERPREEVTKNHMEEKATAQPLEEEPTRKPVEETQEPSETFNSPVEKVTPFPVSSAEQVTVIEPIQQPLPSPTIAPHIHEFEKYVWEEATCQKGGYYNNICKICEEVECVNQEPLPHEVEDIVVQEGNCMEDTVIEHICKSCGLKVESDTRVTVDDKHSWIREEVDGAIVEYCEWCGVARS